MIRSHIGEVLTGDGIRIKVFQKPMKIKAGSGMALPLFFRGLPDACFLLLIVNLEGQPWL